MINQLLGDLFTELRKPENKPAVFGYKSLFANERDALRAKCYHLFYIISGAAAEKVLYGSYKFSVPESNEDRLTDPRLKRICAFFGINFYDFCNHPDRVEFDFMKVKLVDKDIGNNGKFIDLYVLFECIVKYVLLCVRVYNSVKKRLTNSFFLNLCSLQIYFIFSYFQSTKIRRSS